MFSTVNQPAVQHGLIAEVAGSAAFQDALFWVYGAIGAFAVLCLIAGYAVTRILESTDRPSIPPRPPVAWVGPASTVLQIAGGA